MKLQSQVFTCRQSQIFTKSEVAGWRSWSKRRFAPTVTAILRRLVLRRRNTIQTQKP